MSDFGLYLSRQIALWALANGFVVNCLVFNCLLFGPSPTLAQDNDAKAMAEINPRLVQSYPPIQINEQQVAANGIRKIAGNHLIIYTDVRDRDDFDDLANVYDLAVPQWCRYFSVEPARARPWRLRAFVIQDLARFRQAGLIPDELPDFLAGYQRGSEIWIYSQPGNYYTRHLLLHEGTHAFMDWFLGGFGSPWYSEGMAELLGLHRWNNGQLILNYNVKDRSESEYWGRIKIIRREFQNGNILSLDDVLNTPNAAFREVDRYAWAWAACEFLANHPLSQKGFSDFYLQTQQPPAQFNATAKQALAKQWSHLDRDWYLFLGDMDYGYDVRKSRLISADPAKLENGLAVVNIRADHSWQKTSIEVKQGDRLRFRCRSSYQVANTTKPWICQANGITIDYFQHRPLGMLMVGVLDRNAATAEDGVQGLLQPIAVGRESDITWERPGTICFRINESPANLDDNQGTLEVVVEKLR